MSSLFKFRVRPPLLFRNDAVLDRVHNVACPGCNRWILRSHHHAITDCDHHFHRDCLLELIYRSPNQIATCPTCQQNLERTFSSIPRPYVHPDDFPNAAPVVGALPPALRFQRQMQQHQAGAGAAFNIALIDYAHIPVVPRETVYVTVSRTSGSSLQNFTDRVRVPLYLEEHDLTRLSTIVLQGRNRLFMGEFYSAMSVRANSTSVLLLPNVVSDLRSWWARHKYKREEYDACLIRCTELLASVDADASLIEFTTKWAPIIAVLGDEDRHEYAQYVQDDYFDLSDNLYLKVAVGVAFAVGFLSHLRWR